jgi:hypothetical protein
VSNDGASCLSPNLTKISLCQAGYGLNTPMVERWRHRGAPRDDGLFLTDTATGASRLLVSLAEIAALLEERNVAPDLPAGGLYGFHVKWNRDDSRIMFLVRWLAAGDLQARTRNYIVTLRADGSELALALDADRWAGGHHPNWCPDGENIVMNLRFQTGNPLLAGSARYLERAGRKLGLNLRSRYDRLRFARFRHDGGDLKPLSASHEGSGHPTVHRDGRHLVSDAYTGEPVAFGDGSVPIRVLDLQTDREQCVVRMPCRPRFPGPRHELRVDPHPAWDPTHRWIVFNGCPNGARQVFAADMRSVLDGDLAEDAGSADRGDPVPFGEGSTSPRAAKVASA